MSNGTTQSVELDCWPETTDFNFDDFKDRFSSCWLDDYLREIVLQCVNALLTVSASWALTVLFPICFLRIFAFDWKYVEELVPEILHDYSQRLLLYKVLATVVMFAMLYDTLDAAKIDLKSIVSMTQIISLSFSLAARPLITNIIDGLYLVIGNTLKRDLELELNGVRRAKITRLNLTTAELKPDGEDCVIHVPYAMIASSVFIVHSSGSFGNTNLPKKVEPTANYEGDNEADAVGANSDGRRY